MRAIRKTILFTALVCSFLALGQETTSSSDFANPPNDHIHLHLNKTTFFKGEHLWFKAYLQDENVGEPSPTTNLHVGVFDEDGEQLVKKLVLISGGVGQGDITIDSTFVDGSYTLMAWTNYMKNFRQTTPFLQKFKILGNAAGDEQAANNVSILLKPEGQRLVPNAFNAVGITLYDAGLRPVTTNDIELVTSEGTVVQTNIQTNALGQGRFSFFVEGDQNYQVRVKDADGNWVAQNIKVDATADITLAIENRAKDVVVLRPRCAADAVPAIADNMYTLAIFHNNVIVYTQDYEFSPTPDLVSVNREAIPEGINTAVILDEQMMPITQRMFFNRLAVHQRVHGVELSYQLTQQQDSLRISVQLPLGHPSANLSMSVLPTRTAAYKPNNSIASSLLLQPFLEQPLTQGGYFFDGSQRSRSYQLDTQLLMEGTSKFTWNPNRSVIRQLLYQEEHLIPIRGKIIDADTEKEKQVSVFSKTLGEMNFLELTSNKDFEGRLPVFEGDSLLVSVLNSKGKLRRPKAELYFKERPERLFDYNIWLRKARDLMAEPTPTEVEDNLNLSDRAIVLEEVLLSAPKRPSTKFQLTTEIQGRIIDSATMRRNPTVINYIRKLGFQTQSNEYGDGLEVIVSDPPGVARVPVLMEGMVVSAGELMNLPLSSVQSLVYNRLVTPHQGPFIALSLRYDFDRASNYVPLKITKGFAKPQGYFNPIYPDYDSLLYKKYAAIWWEPQVIANEETPTTITIPLNEQKTFKVFIEGMSNTGLLYQSEQLLRPFEVNEAGN